VQIDLFDGQIGDMKHITGTQEFRHKSAGINES